MEVILSADRCPSPGWKTHGASVWIGKLSYDIQSANLTHADE